MAQMSDGGFTALTTRSAFTSPGYGFPGAKRPGHAGPRRTTKRRYKAWPK